MRLRQVVVLMVVVATTTLAGCGGNDESSSPETVADLDGTYQMTVAEEDAAEIGGASPGEWTLTINAGDASFDGPGERRLLHTVRGAGYALRTEP